jgi:putative redox protein
MPHIKLKYRENLNVESTHVPTNTVLQTDAPLDNQGLGRSFSPTDLLATAYASCMLTIIGIFCRENNLVFTDLTADVKKHMSSNPRRVGELDVQIAFTGVNWSDKDILKMERAAKNCPVALSLHPDTKVNIEFKYI